MTIETTLRLIFDNPKGARPKAGQLFMLHTSEGFIPGGIVSLGAHFGTCAQAHLYRALLEDPDDTSFYPLVEHNDLLLPPLPLYRNEFKAGGYVRALKRKDAPTAVPLEDYYYLIMASVWDRDRRAFTRDDYTETDTELLFGCEQPYPDDVVHVGDAAGEYRGDPAPGEQRTNPWVSPLEPLFDNHVEYALEESLSYYGLINTPRPTQPVMDRDPQAIIHSVDELHADTDNPHKATASTDTEPADTGDEPVDEAGPAPEIETTDTGLKITLTAIGEYLDDYAGHQSIYAQVIPDSVLETTINNTGHEANGYFLEAVLQYWGTTGSVVKSIDLDPEASGIDIIGTPDHLTAVKEQLTTMANSPEAIPGLITAIEESGIHIDD